MLSSAGRALCILAVSLIAACSSSELEAESNLPPKAVDFQLTLPGASKIVGRYMCPSLVSANEARAGNGRPKFETVAAASGDSVYLVNTPDTPGMFCVEGSYSGYRALVGTFNIYQLARSDDGRRLFLDRLLPEDAQSSPSAFGISVNSAKEVHNASARSPAVQVHEGKFDARYLSASIIPVAIEPSGNRMSSLDHSAAIKLLRQRFGVSHAITLLSPSTMCQGAGETLRQAIDRLPANDSRRPALASFIGNCVPPRTTAGMPVSVTMIDAIIGKARPGNLDGGRWVYDLRFAGGGGFLVTCMIGSTQCPVTGMSEPKQRIAEIEIILQDQTRRNLKIDEQAPVTAYYVRNSDLRDSILFISGYPKLFDLRGAQ